MTATILMMLAVFAASSVESIEAFSVALAVSVTRGRRPAIQGVVAAVVVLAAFIAAGGLPLMHLVPLRWLQLSTGILMLYVGQKWIRKAVLRASGRKALHNEDKTYTETTDKLRSSDASGARIAFGATILEGSEVLMIVVGLGSGAHRLAQAGLAAVAACVVVAIVGCIVAKPLSRIDENAMKFAVSVMLLSFAIFWIGEGSGLAWPGRDASIIGLLVIVALLALAAVRVLRKSARIAS